MDRIKCITFDQEAQNNLPKWVKDKMQKDRKEAQKKQLAIQVVKPMLLCVEKDTTFLNITLGNKYEMLQDIRHSYVIINDEGNEQVYGKERFKKLK